MNRLIAVLLIIFIVACNKSAGDASAVGGNGQGGSLARFTIVGNYLYSVDHKSLRVFNIAAPDQPSSVSTIPVGFEIETIFPFKDKLFIGSTSVVYIYSISDPTHPQKLGEAISPDVMRRCDPVVAKDNVAYATLRTNGPCGGTTSVLAVYDITDITHPVPKNALAVNEPYGLGYSENALYVCDRIAGLVVYNISQPFSPVEVKRVLMNSADFIDVIPFNNILVCWTTTGMALFDITARFDPVLITTVH